MADRIITVTDPSVVTNDTLSGYNNYSDIDGQLGTTMTPTEATNGHTVALSDGVIHEVTTKPVGTTNGEFSAVVSNAVTVDLSGVSYLYENDFSSTLGIVHSPNQTNVPVTLESGRARSTRNTASTGTPLQMDLEQAGCVNGNTYEISYLAADVSVTDGTEVVSYFPALLGANEVDSTLISSLPATVTFQFTPTDVTSDIVVVSVPVALEIGDYMEIDNLTILDVTP